MAQAPGVTVGNAAKIAAELVSLHLTTGIELDTVIGLWHSTTGTVVDGMAEHTIDTSPPAVPGGNPGVPPAIANAFPGTTVEPQAQPQVAPPAYVAPPAAPAAAPAVANNVVPFPGAGPAPVPGVQPQGQPDPALEEAWRVFFDDVQKGTFAANWTDNRAQKAQGGKYAKIPDFKHNSWTRPGEKWPVGLYISDKKAPAWVAGALAQIGVA